MTEKYCERCGSSKVFADRSLGGRLACSYCGSTLISNKNPFKSNLSLIRKPRRLCAYVLLAIIVLIIII